MTEPSPRSAAPDAFPDGLTTRFSDALARLWGGNGRFGLAVSGGPDSLAMLLLSEAVFPGFFEVATVDHGLRLESVEECAMVERLCAERNIPCQVLRVTVNGGNLQSQAREARYEALLDWADDRGIHEIATAHHADDQTETLLMRLNRGSGVDGLAGVREQTYIGDRVPSIIRPMLGFRRAELAEIVRIAGVTAIADPSNESDKFDRVRIRKALRECDWLDPSSLAQSAANLAEAEEAICWYARAEWNEQAVSTPDEIRYLGRFNKFGHVRWVPREITIRIVDMALRHLGGSARKSEIARLVSRLEGNRSGNLAGVLATVEGKEWVFRAEPPRRTPR